MCTYLCTYRVVSKPAEQSIDPAEHQIINLDLLNQHIKNVVDHFTSCSRNLGLFGNQIILSGEKHHGLASILSWKWTRNGFPTSTKASGPIGKQWTTNLATE